MYRLANEIVYSGYGLNTGKAPACNDKGKQWAP
jgi:hypothetical protein